jgi:hypothetical protein
VTFQKSVKPADAATSNRPRKHAHLGYPRRALASTSRHFIQPFDSRDSFVSLGDVAAGSLSRLERARR